MTQTAESTYLMGRTERERQRLFLQGSILNPLTEEFLRTAGLSTGMRVLDLGCGIGDVSLVAAALVGDSGQVTALDKDEQALQVARARASEAGYGHVRFEHTDFANYRSERLFDAVVGRQLLIHTGDALALLRTAASFVRSGGIVAFQEYDLSFWPPGYPRLPLAAKLGTLLVDLFRRGTPHANIGMRLYRLMHEAGLSKPQARAQTLIDGGPDSLFYEWLAETVRSVLPSLEALGLATAAEIDADTLTERLREETVSEAGCLTTPLIVSASARKP